MSNALESFPNHSLSFPALDYTISAKQDNLRIKLGSLLIVSKLDAFEVKPYIFLQEIIHFKLETFRDKILVRLRVGKEFSIIFNSLTHLPNK